MFGNPQHWGPSAWNFLHTLTFHYPDNPSVEEQRSIEKLFDSLQYLLPCNECRQHFILEMSRNPIDARSKTSVSVWLVDLHNRINLRLGKPIFSYSHAVSKYTSTCSSCTKETVLAKTDQKSTMSIQTFSILVIVLLVIGVVVAKYRSKI